jgi:hypothetical protein
MLKEKQSDLLDPSALVGTESTLGVVAGNKMSCGSTLA